MPGADPNAPMDEVRAVNPQTQVAKRKKSPKELFEESMNEGLQLRGFQMGLGAEAVHPSAAVKATESTNVNLGDIFRGMSELNVGLANQLLQSRESGGPDPNQERLWTFLTAQLQRLQDRQDQAIQQKNQDPFSLVFENLGKYQQLVSGLQQRDPMNPMLAQAGMNIESLKLQAQMEMNKQQHEEKMETMRQQWKREDERWMKEFQLKVAQTQSSEKRAQEAGGFLQDLAGALAGALEPGSTASTTVAAAPPRQPRLKTFKCRPPQGCGATVHVASPDSTEAVCGNCGLTWDLGGAPPPPAGPVSPPADLPPFVSPEVPSSFTPPHIAEEEE